MKRPLPCAAKNRLNGGAFQLWKCFQSAVPPARRIAYEGDPAWNCELHRIVYGLLEALASTERAHVLKDVMLTNQSVRDTSRVPPGILSSVGEEYLAPSLETGEERSSHGRQQDRSSKQDQPWRLRPLLQGLCTLFLVKNANLLGERGDALREF
jgi:hypothetical protein